MFIAKDPRGNLISVLNLPREKLPVLKKSEYYCPSCHRPVILKAGTKKLPHFAHKTRCPVKTEGESEIHLLGKKKLYEWLVSQGIKPEIEKYIREIHQQPDLFFQWNGKNIALEFQCSVISIREMERRTTNYLKHGFIPLWILYNERINHRSGILQFNEFLSCFLTKSKTASPLIISFQPETDRFYTYQPIIPFSTNRACAMKMSFSLYTPLSVLFSHRCPSDRLIENWLNMAEKSLIRMSLLPDARKNPFLQFLYHQRIHPVELPPEVGVPVPEMFFIKNSPFEWQAYIWLYFLYRQKTGTVIHKREIERFVLNKMKEKVLFRHLPSFNEKETIRPVAYYFQYLVNTGFFERAGETLIVRKTSALMQKANLYRTEQRKKWFIQQKHALHRLFLLTKH